MKFKSGFTLIELLIVVAIIAILAAIAVPNMLEAQVRAKVARAKSDMRTMGTALEQYAVDYNGYEDVFTRLNTLTTPVAYISSLPQDVFRIQQGEGRGANWRRTYRYGANGFGVASKWILASNGPDTDIDTYFNANADNDQTDNWEADGEALRSYPGHDPLLYTDAGWQPSPTQGTFKYIRYDATNGTVSNGDLFRSGDSNNN